MQKDKFDREAVRFLRRLRNVKPDRVQLMTLVACVMQQMDIDEDDVAILSDDFHDVARHEWQAWLAERERELA